MSESTLSERVLVALHGNFASSAWWQDLQHDPPSGWRVLAPDLPGFAGTAFEGEVSIRRYADWLAGWLAERHVTRPVLLGHSLGGAVALEFASRYPLSGLILAASAPLDGLMTPEENYPVLELMRSKPELLEMSLAALFPSRKPRYFAQLVTGGGRMVPGHYSGNARALAAWQVDPASLRGIPVQVLGGSEDKLVTPEMIRAQAEVLGTSPVIFQGLGHGFPQEDARGFKRQIEAFLGQWPGS